MIACPLCRAVNESGPNCRRCRADLSLLFTVDRQRDAALAAALQALAGGRLDDARRRLEQAEAIRPGGDSARLNALAALLDRDFGAAWHHFWRERRFRAG